MAMRGIVVVLPPKSLGPSCATVPATLLHTTRARHSHSHRPLRFTRVRHCHRPLRLTSASSAPHHAQLKEEEEEENPKDDQKEKEKEKEEEEEEEPQWSMDDDNSDKCEAEIGEIVADTFGDPEEFRKRIEERVRKKSGDIFQPKTGSAVPLRVTFKSFDPISAYIWMELYSAPSNEDVEIIGSAIRSWYLLGRLGGFNSLNLQLFRAPVDARPSYDEDREEEPLPANFHNIEDLEFQNNWGRFWVDLGTSDRLPLDVLINALNAVSSDHVGIKQVTFGGEGLGRWKEGMKLGNEGYKSYKF